MYNCLIWTDWGGAFVDIQISERMVITRNTHRQRSAGTFPAGLPDGGVVFENPLERPERADIR